MLNDNMSHFILLKHQNRSWVLYSVHETREVLQYVNLFPKHEKENCTMRQWKITRDRDSQIFPMTELKLQKVNFTSKNPDRLKK